ncbi:MAG TPA: hypothetical protein VNF26_03510 [Candidatus Baltobacterales bacterium]|nr:hypothetical protein [Candidatus Baltobacterales bacterium]
MVDRLLKDLALEHPGIARGTGRTHCGTIPACGVTPVVAMNSSPTRGGFSVHRPAAPSAKKDWGERIGVLGPRFAGSPDIASPDFFAGTPGEFVNQSGVEAFEELALDDDLAHVRGVADHVFEDIAREDDRLRSVVVRLVVAAEGPNAVPVQVLSQAAEAKSASGVEAKDLLDCRGRSRVFNDLAVDAPIALRDGAQQFAVATQVAEIVADAPSDLLSFLLRDDRLDLPRQPVDVTDQAVPVEHKDLALGHLGHEAKELEVVAMEAIGVIEGNRTDLGRRRCPDALHEGEVARPLGRLLARSVSVLEVLEGETLQLRSAGHCVELLVQ